MQEFLAAKVSSALWDKRSRGEKLEYLIFKG